MIETIIAFVPQSIIPYFIERWKNNKTRYETWLELAELRYNKMWAFQIDKDKCFRRATRFAYGCRWNKLKNIIKSHKKEGRIVINGHFSYLVRDDLAMQSCCFSFDQSLITSLLDDKYIERKMFNISSKNKLIQFTNVLHDYFCLNHREFYEKYLGKNIWERMGISNSDFSRLYDAKGKLNIKKYEALLRSKSRYEETIEYKLLTNTDDYFINLMKISEVEQYTAIQPNTIFGEVNSLKEYTKNEIVTKLLEKP